MSKIISKKKGVSQRLTISLRIIGIVLVLVLTLFLFSLTNAGSTVFSRISQTISDTVDSIVDSSKNEDEMYAKAVVYIEDGDSQKAINMYENKVANTDGDSEKASLYIRLSQAFSGYAKSTEDKKFALTYAQKAENSSPSVQSAVQLKDSYALLGDTDNSTKYENITGERVTKQPSAKEGSPDGYDN